MEIFKKPHDALMFAFRFSDQQYAISALGKMMKGRLGSGKGLVALDGAGQAGFILERVGRLSEVEQACIVCRYSDRFAKCECRNPCCSGEVVIKEYADAIKLLDDKVALPAITGLSHRMLRHHIIRHYFERGGKGSKARIETVGKAADRLKVPKRTAYDLKAKIENALRDIDKTALTKINESLSSMLGEDAA